MRVGVGELDGDRPDLEAQWDGLTAATAGAGLGLVVLPEMPFSRWLAASPDVDDRAWERAVDDHDRWCERLGELDAGVRVAAVTAGAFGLSTNRAGGRGGTTFGGGSVIVDPEGLVLARSTPGSPLTTAEVDLERADRATST